MIVTTLYNVKKCWSSDLKSLLQHLFYVIHRELHNYWVRLYKLTRLTLE